MTPQDELVNYLREIAAKSAKAEIVWTQANITTFSWRKMDQDGSRLQTTIQRATSGPSVEFLFTVSKLKPPSGSYTQVISLSSAEKSIFRQPLGELFNAAQMSADAQAVKVLKGLLG